MSFILADHSSVAFFGDMVLSRACHEDMIVLWRIDGFSSLGPPPSPLDAPSTSDTERLTRSAFVPASASGAPQYTRKVQFWTPGSGHQFYMRFNLYHNEDRHPILAFGNAQSTIFFWDLARLTEYHQFMDDLERPNRDAIVRRPDWLQPAKATQKVDAVSKLRGDAEDKDSVASGRTGSDVETFATSIDQYSQETLESWYGKYSMIHEFEAIRSHSQRAIPIKDFIGRQVAWSALGDWCVVVGSKNHAIILARWQKKDTDRKPTK